jgi:hypothetical protein
LTPRIVDDDLDRVYGAKRGNHGQYEVACACVLVLLLVVGFRFAHASCFGLQLVDDGAPWTGNGTAVPDTFQTLLYGISNLTLGSHTLTLTNKPTDSNHTWVDIDYVIFADGLPDNTPTFVADIEGAGFEYFPDISHWERANDNNTFGGSIWRTQSNDGSIKLTFNGEAVALYGRTGSSNAHTSAALMISILLPRVILCWTADQQILCYANNLDKDVEHTLHVFNQPNGSKAWLEVDYARIWGENAYVPPVTWL